MKAIANEIIVNYFEIKEGDPMYLLQKWVEKFGDRFDNYFVHHRGFIDGGIVEIKLSGGRNLKILANDVIIRKTIAGSADYSLVSKKVFIENYKL